MITDIRNIEVFENGSLDIEEYHSREGISSSGLNTIFEDCPAMYRHGHYESKSMHFGTASHAAILEPELFEKRYLRKVDESDFEECYTSDTKVKARLKELGVKGYSTKSGKELHEFALEFEPEMKILKLEIDRQSNDNPDRIIIPSDDFEMISRMRDCLFANPEYAEMVKGAFVETSIICEVKIKGAIDEWIKVKIRPDMITKKGVVPDYKTTRDVRPDHFGRLAFQQGYWLRQAFVTDVLAAVYGMNFRPALLAQGKIEPYIPQLYMMTEGQIQYGRMNYIDALITYSDCLRDNVWPSYSDGSMPLQTPDWIGNQMEDK